MRILVTGGAGFIGSNLVQALLSSGLHDVAVVDDLSTGKPENIDPRTSFRKLDILAPEFPAFVAEFAPDGIVHLAAQASVSESMRDPERDRAVNAGGTHIVAAAAKAAGVRRMISASSAAVYGEPEAVPLVETARKAPENPYGASKLEAETLIAEELRGSGTDFASFRFSNVYGPRQDAQGEGGVVAIFCDRVAAGAVPTVYGDGSQTRDFIYVGDIVAAIIAALGAEGPLAGDGPDGPAYNISTGDETSVNELLMSIRQAAKYFGPAENLPAREGDVARSALDPSKARSGFGFSAGVELDSGIALTWRWFSATR